MAWGVLVMPSFIVFILVSLSGLFFAILSSGLLGLWISLELGFFGFIPILNGKTVAENEVAAKYFVVQGVGSGLMLISFMFFSVGSNLGIPFIIVESLIYLFLLSGFMIKLGVFPFHFWFPSVMGGASWFSCFWLSVVQKVGPFWGISGLGLVGWVLDSILFFLIITSVVGGFGGLAQTQFRPLLAYSSLGQTGWMGLVSILSLKVFIMYMFIYSLLLSGLLSCLHLINSYMITDVPGLISSKGIFFWLFSGSFFVSLSGVPPLAGSALKLAGVMIIVNNYPVYLIILIFVSMVSLYFYLSMFISSVVCLGDSKANFYSNTLMSKGLLMGVSTLVLVNWVGGFPLFLMCGGLML